MDIYRAGDGRHWGAYEHNYVVHLVKLVPAVQDETTGRWAWGDLTTHVTVTEDELASAYDVVPPESLRDPRITRLGVLVERLLAEHATATGQPAAAADEIRDALADVREIPEEWARKRTAAARNAARGSRRHRR